ncbi:conserved Plasmodium protein, unknown function [Plasmodium ovale curtisi]|uniref:Uncharacterized protein n=1 Tax=Plasmodium ovale curtisi TaxID=864141 RepID=A0A1A8VYW5_PLAOA|nr:conserved Plasmodium protein, unknown function [Plasmodium ovale curtisi]
MKSYRILFWNTFKRRISPSFGKSKETLTHPLGDVKVEETSPLSAAYVSSPSSASHPASTPRPVYTNIGTNFAKRDPLKEITNEKQGSHNIVTLFRQYNLHITYYSVLFFLFSVFSYCVTKFLWMILEEPPALRMVKEQVLKDKKLVDEYEEVIFSRFWTGYINENNARIVINVRSKKHKKWGKIISNLIQKNNKWVIKTLTYYNVKKNDNIKTDDLKTLEENTKQNSGCPVDHGSFLKKKN